ncbi:carbohydrate ABC transporter permease [Ilumatobacter coccineus]|uniref:Putative sugar ABC transporter permease protein n=1 Tax=Ilumatobacter coccineus (strain NBRC 103263 / KCTC 29153 / YM16-304) TaxID=1313172 RepID=A0A6C7E0Z4_ILUCY|nr:sugar ABC transporter permease [Ilumatobacter coccineus]BAN00613.1 putative sugar ABC transporter permease protein [Ilumatobacter coccineus YM16-304]
MSDAVTEHTEPQSIEYDEPTDHADEVKRLERREGWKRRLPILPALLFTILVTQIPFLFTLFYSLTEWRLDTPEPREVIGFENYAALPDDKFFRDAAWVSVKMTVSAVLLSLIVGTGLALLLDRKFFGQGFVRTLLITPFLVMPVVAGLLWKTQMFNSTFGVINWFIETLGFGPTEFATRFPLASVVVVLVWQWSPFMMLIVLAGLQGQDASTLEAARVDGATSWGTFRQITFPQLRPYLELGTLLGAIYLIQVYDHIEIITGGSPDSKNLPFYIAQRSIGGGNRFGLASSYSIIVVIASIIIANIGLRVLSGLLEDDS